MKKVAKVSFLIPVLNEENNIKQSLDSILQLEYPKDKIEIVLALGKSTDNTNDIVKKYKKKHPNIIKTFENPTGSTAIGRNICIDNSTGDLLMNYSAHAIAKKNLLTVLSNRLLTSKEPLASVGCANVSPNQQNFIARTAAAVFSSFIGGKNVFVQNAEYYEERYTNHISFALYKKEPVIEVGKFDPGFWCGQDAELDLRLVQKGYKILFTPETKVYHYKRDTLRALFKQMYRYGIARAKMSKKHPKTLKPFHLIGAAFIFGIIFVILLTFLQFLPLWMPVLLAILYVIASMVCSSTATKEIGGILSSPLFALIIHVGYGLGFLRGLIYGKL